MIKLNQVGNPASSVSDKYFCLIKDRKMDEADSTPHYHSSIELLYGVKGLFEVYINGRKFLLKEKNLIYINAGEVHRIHCPKQEQEKSRYLTVGFEPDILINCMPQMYYQIQYLLPFMLYNQEREKLFSEELIRDTCLPALFSEILSEFKNCDYGHELAIENHIGRIFLWFLRYWYKFGIKLDINSMAAEELIKKLQPAFDYVLGHYKEELKASEMAKLCGLSYSHFSRKFNNLMKMNFNEYVNYIRITEAERLLLLSSYNISEVAEMVGFSTTSYFIKLFKMFKHVSPKQFKKEIVEGIIN